jgi:hypothetical protein
MSRKPQESNQAWEDDAVWKLLDKAAPARTSPRFAENTVRTARLIKQPVSWWKRWFAPIPMASLAAATAAITLAVVSLTQSGSKIDNSAAIQEIAATEALLAASDNLNDFSDQELVCLIGF